MAAPECLARKFGHYPTGNRESLIYFEQKVTQSAPCFRQVLWRVSSKEGLRWGMGGPRQEIRGREAGQEKQQRKCRQGSPEGYQLVKTRCEKG